MWLLPAIALAAVPASGQVPTVAGIVQGERVQGEGGSALLVWRGIPFAAPPVGPLRWRAPQPPARWQGVRDATRYGADCMQQPFPGDYAPRGTQPAEDCLYLNIWRADPALRPLPVLVWIYGGGFVNGGASPPTYSGASLAAQGVMVVSFNYRVGRFGFFAHPALTRADADGGQIVDYGYLDQLAALRWVQRNIAAFGGDPARVTVAGESAGGMSVQFLLTSPLAHGLFAGAVIMSGGPDPDAADTLAMAEAQGIAFARGHGIDGNGPDALAQLRALSAAEVTDGLNMAALFHPVPGPRTFSRPIADGRIAVDPFAAYRRGDQQRVPVMIGATSDDMGGPGGFMATGARTAAGLLAAQGSPTFAYVFGYVATASRATSAAGAGHATDVPFFLGTEAIRYGAQTSAQDRAAGSLASAYLARFVRDGDPNGGGLPHWPRYTPGRPTLLAFRADGTAAAIADAVRAR